MGQVAPGIDHLRLNPDTELEAFLMGIGGHIVDAFGNLGRIHFPVTQAGVIPVAGIVLRKPAVVQDEHLEAHRGRVVNHPEEGFGREGEIGAFPAVQKGGIDLSAPINAVVPGPGVQVAGSLSRPAAGVGIDERRRPKDFAGCQFIGRGERTDPGQDCQPVGLVHLERQAEVTTPGQGAGDDFAHVLLQAVRIQTHQEGRVVALGDLRTAARLDHLRIMRKEFSLHLHLVGPTAVEMGQIILVRIQVQGTGGIVQQLHRLLAGVLDLRMGADDIFLLVGVIDESDFQGGDRILQEDLRRDDIPVLDRLMVHIDQLGVVVAVGILHMKGRLAEVAAARGGIGHGPFPIVRPPARPEGGESRRIGDLRPEMDRLQDTVFLRDEDELRMRRLHRDDGFRGCPGRNGQGGSQ